MNNLNKELAKIENTTSGAGIREWSIGAKKEARRIWNTPGEDIDIALVYVAIDNLASTQSLYILGCRVIID